MQDHVYTRFLHAVDCDGRQTPSIVEPHAERHMLLLLLLHRYRKMQYISSMRTGKTCGRHADMSFSIAVNLS
jgi:hypothetical protein